MKKFFALLTSLLLVERNLYAAEAGMPQLDPESVSYTHLRAHET